MLSLPLVDRSPTRIAYFVMERDADEYVRSHHWLWWWVPPRINGARVWH